MRGTRLPDVRIEAPGPHPHRAGWPNLTWKLLIAFAILLLMLVGVPVPEALVASVRGVLLLWGALFVTVACDGLFGAQAASTGRWLWVVLALGAYSALSIPAVVLNDPAKIIDALGLVAALTLAAQLGRRDLPQALRSWAVIMGVVLYGALSVHAMWFIITTFGVVLFACTVLGPVLLYEGLHLLPRGMRPARAMGAPSWLLALIATLVPVGVLTFTQFDRTMAPEWLVFFVVMAVVLLGGALLVSLLTRPMLQVVPGSRSSVARALLELSHGAFLISLVAYIPLRLFFVQGLS